MTANVVSLLALALVAHAWNPRLYGNRFLVNAVAWLVQIWAFVAIALCVHSVHC